VADGQGHNGTAVNPVADNAFADPMAGEYGGIYTPTH
jgi:hypothetical protein